MKRFKHIFRTILVVLLINLTTKAWAQEITRTAADIPAQETRVNPRTENWLDSVEISLLTCGPGHEVWSYYGHTALRIQDKAHGSDVAVNWGMFSFNQDYFILRFVFGRTDYQIGIFPMSDFIAEYASEGRWVRQQTLCLSAEEKLKILQAIELNAQPENRTYRYNFFYDNCTTRARAVIINNLGKGETDFKNIDSQSTYRDEIHRWNGDHRWARFGNDLLLGFEADRPISKTEWEFLPENLSADFAVEARKDTAREAGAEGAIAAKKGFISLVDTTFYVVPPQAEVVENELVTPWVVFLCLFVLISMVCGWEVYQKKNLWWFDTLLLVLTGLPGLILLAMIFSEHPTVQLNFQLLILNPLNLVFAWKVAKKLRKGKKHWYYDLWGGLLVVALLLAIWQDYAEGMKFLALSLLVRYVTRSILTEYKKKLKKKENGQ